MRDGHCEAIANSVECVTDIANPSQIEGKQGVLYDWSGEVAKVSECCCQIMQSGNKYPIRKSCKSVKLYAN